MAIDLCPRCGAYWRCSCPPPGVEPFLPDPACEHDWTSAVGVELLEDDLAEAGARVMLCRLCGIYGIEAPA
jgi:hypothetical protein